MVLGTAVGLVSSAGSSLTQQTGCGSKILSLLIHASSFSGCKKAVKRIVLFVFAVQLSVISQICCVCSFKPKLGLLLIGE